MLTFWTDEEAIAMWEAKTEHREKGRPSLFSDLVITTALWLNAFYTLELQALKDFINSVFKLGDISQFCPHYTCISKRSKKRQYRLQKQDQRLH